MKIDILVEEPSMKGFLEPVLPKIISPPDIWSIHVLSCFKTKLEKRLRGFTHLDPGKYRIIIISDLDRKDCREMKQWLEDIRSPGRSSYKNQPRYGWFLFGDNKTCYSGIGIMDTGRFPRNTCGL